MNLSSISCARLLNGVALAACAFVAVAAFLGNAPSLLDKVGDVGVYAIAALLVASLLLLRKSDREIGRMTATVSALAKGDLESRLTAIKEKGNIAELEWALNGMADAVDSFVREASATMEHVSHNKYFRRILEAGMHGALLNGARIINRAADNTEDKMNGFVSVATDLDASLTEVVQQINTTAQTLESSAGTMRNSVTVTAQGTDAATRSSDSASMSVQTISSAAEEMSSSIAEISQQISRASSVAKEAVEHSEKSRMIFTSLTQMAEKIGDVVKIIEDIASQTNLLALNATIEAARAGEAGKGFAVVANEVKALAGQTGKATEEISALIINIQNTTKDVVGAFSSMGSIIGEIETAATTVAAAVEEQSAASREIASSAEKASEGTSTAAVNVKDISQSMAQVGRAANDIVAATDILSKQTIQRVHALLDKMSTFMTELKKVA